LQREVQLAPTDRLDKQLIGSFLMKDTVFSFEIRKGQRQPAGEINVGAKAIDLTLGENNGDLNSALPTPFLDVKHTGVCEGSFLHWLRSDEQGHAELGGFWCMLSCHEVHCSTTTNPNGRLIDGFTARR